MNKYFKKLYSGFTLKLISTVLFVAGRVLLELGFSKAGTMYRIGNIMIYIALPIIYFLGVEAYKHTRSVKRLIIRLFVVGLVGEVIIDFSLFGKEISKYFSGNNLNLFLTMAMGVGMLALLDFFRGSFKNQPVWRNLLTILTIIVFAGLAVFAGLEEGGGAIFTMAAMYLFYGNPFFILIAVGAIQIVVLGSAAFMIMYAPIIGVIITWFYNGERGYKSIASQAFFYGIYPIVYSITAMIIMAAL